MKEDIKITNLIAGIEPLEYFKELNGKIDTDKRYENIQELINLSQKEFVNFLQESPEGIVSINIKEAEGTNLTGGAKMTKKKRIDDIELEAMINIKYRHNVSEKLVLNKQDMVLDKLLKLYKGRISDKNLKQLKKVSEDQKVNYFRFTMTDVGNNFYKLNYSISDLFIRTLIVQLKIRSISNITPDKKTEFKQKYENIEDKSEEFKSFYQKFYELLNKKDELFKIAKETHKKLDKKEINYSEYEEKNKNLKKQKENLIILKMN